MGEIIKPSKDFLGRGLVTPLRRLGASDFVASTGVQLVRAAIRQIVGTRRGEVPWAPDFGVLVEQLRNRPNTEELEALIASDLEAALRRWEPRVEGLRVTPKRDGSTLTARIDWAIISKNVPGNQVVVGPDSFEVRI